MNRLKAASHRDLFMCYSRLSLSWTTFLSHFSTGTVLFLVQLSTAFICHFQDVGISRTVFPDFCSSLCWAALKPRVWEPDSYAGTRLIGIQACLSYPVDNTVVFGTWKKWYNPHCQNLLSHLKLQIFCTSEDPHLCFHLYPGWEIYSKSGTKSQKSSYFQCRTINLLFFVPSCFTRTELTALIPTAKSFTMSGLWGGED